MILRIKLQYNDARIDALQATKKHEVRDSKVSGTNFHLPPDMIDKKHFRLDLIMKVMLN